MLWLFEQSAFFGGIAIMLLMAIIFGIWNLIENRKKAVHELQSIFVKCMFFILFLVGSTLGAVFLIGTLRLAINPGPPNDEGVNYLLLLCFGFGVGSYLLIQSIRMLIEFFKKDGAFKKISQINDGAKKNNDALVAAIMILFLFVLGWWYMFAN